MHLLSVRGERGFVTVGGDWLIRGPDIGVDRSPARPARVRVDGGHRFLHEDGRMVPPRDLPGFELAYPFEEGHATVHIDGSGCFVNAKGEVVLKTQYRQLSWLVNGHALASHEPRRYDQGEQAYCKIDISGNVVAETRAGALNAESEGYHMFWRNGRAGYMDAQLRVVIEPRFLRGSP